MALSWLAITCIAILLTSVLIKNRLRVRTTQIERDAEAEKPGRMKLDDALSVPARQLRAKLIAAIPHIVIGPENALEFKESMNAHWDQRACEVAPACVVRPRNVWELAQAVKILKLEFDLRCERAKESNATVEPVFAIRAGGNSPVLGASSIRGGVLVDLSLFNQVTPAEDGKSVAIGAGCRWGAVYERLEKHGLAVAGGRHSGIGVAGLTLGGGLSFFSPRYGFVCSNIIEYEVVLADGSIKIASEESNRDLWRALKGGSNNFGIVTRFTARSFPSTDVWGGFLYLPTWQSPKVLSAFHSYVNRGIKADTDAAYDEHAAGPLLGFCYAHKLGISAISLNIVHTNPPADNNQWPLSWRTSGFLKLWRFWNTCKVQALSGVTDEINVLNPPGLRQKFATTTIKNDAATLEAVHQIWYDGIATVRQQKVKNMAWTMVFQPLLPEWARKGDPNPLGLDSEVNEPLVVVIFPVNWALAKDDERVHRIVRDAIQQIDAFAEKQGTGHPYRYLNYCGSWQKPFEGYGEKNLRFLQDVSRHVDPDGMFQRGCTGGFKLDL